MHTDNAGVVIFSCLASAVGQKIMHEITFLFEPLLNFAIKPQQAHTSDEALQVDTDREAEAQEAKKHPFSCF